MRCLLTGFLPLSATPYIYLICFQPSSSQSRVLSGHAVAHRWRSPPRVRRHKASSPQGSSSNGCCLFRKHHGPFFVSLSFPTPWTIFGTVGMCDTGSIESGTYVCITKFHIIAQSGPVLLVIPCHSHPRVCMYVCIFIKLRITAQHVCMYVCMYYFLNCT